MAVLPTASAAGPAQLRDEEADVGRLHVEQQQGIAHAGAAVGHLGFGRIVARCFCSTTSHQITQRISTAFSETTIVNTTEP